MAGVSAAVAAWFARRAALQVRDQMREARGFWKAERKSEVYRTVARSPVMEARESFVRGTGAVLEVGSEALVAALEGGEEDEANRVRGATIKEFRTTFYEYRKRVNECREIKVLELTGFVDELMKVTEDFQDVVTETLVSEEVSGVRGWEEALTTYSGQVAEIVARYDPALQEVK